MKKIFSLLLFLLPIVSFAENETRKIITKYEKLESETGSIMKYIDYKTQKLSTAGLTLNIKAKIRVVLGEKENSYFLCIEKPELDSKPMYSAIIEYSDLVEINKALEKMASEVEADIAVCPDRIVNKFVTSEGLEIGYYVYQSESGVVSKKWKATWFIILNKCTLFSGTVFESASHPIDLKSTETVLKEFKDAQINIEELKAQYGK